MPLLRRLVFWALDSFVIASAVLFAAYLLNALWPKLAMVPLIGLSALLVSVPSAAYLQWLFPLFAQGQVLNVSTFGLAFEITLTTSLILALQFVIIPHITAALGQANPEAEPEPKALPAASERAPIYQHLPPDLRNAQIISISMEDHYANISTTQGEHLKLMRLSDALQHLGDISGAQVHRSHWVAKQFVHGIEKVGRKYELVLTNGKRLPVSATFLTAALALVSE